MIITKVPLSDLERIADEIGVKFESLHGDVGVRYPRVQGRLIPNREVPLNERPYRRLSTSWMNPERRVFAVCWHGYRDFLVRLFEEFPEAQVRTAFANYKGLDSFIELYPDTAWRNVGAPIYPLYAAEVCEC